MMRHDIERARERVQTIRGRMENGQISAEATPAVLGELLDESERFLDHADGNIQTKLQSEKLIELGIALSAEPNFVKLQEMILREAKKVPAYP